MQRIADFLRKQDINVWVDNEKLLPGTPIWEAEIEKAIKAAAAVIVILSPDSKNSEWVRREITLADQHQTRIFPVLVHGDEESSITLRLITREYVDIRQNEGAGLNSLRTALYFYLGDLEAQERRAKEEAKELFREKAEREAAKKAIREKVELETAKKVTREKTDRELDESEATEKAAKEETKHEVAEKMARRAVVEKGARKKAEREAIDKTKIRPILSSVLWITLGWAIGGAIGGAIYWGMGEYVGDAIGGATAWGISGLVAAMTRSNKSVLSRWKGMLWITLAWALGGAIGWALGDALSEAIGAAVGGAIGGVIGWGITSRFEQGLSNWKSALWITLAWAISAAIGWTIAREIQFNIGGAVGWPIGRAIGGAIGGFVVIWQIRKR